MVFQYKHLTIGRTRVIVIDTIVTNQIFDTKYNNKQLETLKFTNIDPYIVNSHDIFVSNRYLTS